MRKLEIPEEPTRRLPPAGQDSDFPTILGLMLDEELELPAAVRRPERPMAQVIPVVEPELTLELDDTPPPVRALDPTRADGPRASSPKTPVLASSPKTPSLPSSPKTPALPSSPKTPALASSPKTPSLPSNPKTPPLASSPKTPTIPPPERAPSPSYALASIAPRRVPPPRAAAVPFPAAHISSPAVRVARRSLPPETEPEQAPPPWPLPRARPAHIAVRQRSVFSGRPLSLRETEILLAWFLGVVAIIIGAAALRL